VSILGRRGFETTPGGAGWGFRVDVRPAASAVHTVIRSTVEASAMIKLVVTMDRKPETTTAEFRRYYREEHAPLARDLPLLERYTVSFPLDPDESPHDAQAELYYESVDALDDSFASDHGVHVREDVANFADTDSVTRFVAEEAVQVD
jgi:uncharacterized protein (TIGR02118 family)